MIKTEDGYRIDYLGSSFITSHFQEDLTVEECDSIRREFYTKPNTEDLDRQILGLRGNRSMTNHIYNYYFYDLMADCRTKSGMSKGYQKWSIDEFMQSDDLIRFAVAKVRKFPKVYPTKYTDAKNIKTVFRLSQIGRASCGERV